MAFRVHSSSTVLAVSRHLSKSQRDTESALRHLAAGSRIVDAGDDAAGFAISEGLKAQLKGLKQARYNTENALSLIQTAEGGLNEQNNILVRLRELAVQAASDTVGENEREFLDFEFQNLIQELDRMARSTTFGAQPLLLGTGKEYSFQVGVHSDQNNRVTFKLEANTTASNLKLTGLKISDQDDAADTLEIIDDALTEVAGFRAYFGAMQSRFLFTRNHLETQASNIESAYETITDVDVAEEVSKLTRGKILQDMGVAVLAQANAEGARALRLLS